MRRLLVTSAVLGALPVSLLLGVMLLVSPAAEVTCRSLVVAGQVPATLEAPALDGSVIRLDRVQLVHAGTIISVASTIDGADRDAVVVALMAGLTESGLRMYANTTYPLSLQLPHDAVGSDHDSLGIFQMRPSTGWGTVRELMDSTYQARAFFGGAAGPNAGSPRGLLDIPGWRSLPKGVAAQAVEVSAFADRYARFQPVAEAIVDRLTTQPATGAEGQPGAATLPVTAGAVVPLPAGTWTHTSGFGMRLNPVLGVRRLHAGADLAAAAGTSVLATANGIVVAAGRSGGLGNRVIIEHHLATGVVASVYGHLLDGGIHVRPGVLVNAGQQIGDVGSTGNSTGPHLHFEIRPGGQNAPAVDPAQWLADAAQTGSATTAGATPTPACSGAR